MLANGICRLRMAWGKIVKANNANWGTLSFGEKAIRVLFTALKIALFVAAAVLVLVVVVAAWAAFGIMGGIKGAVNDEIWRSRTRYDKW